MTIFSDFLIFILACKKLINSLRYPACRTVGLPEMSSSGSPTFFAPRPRAAYFFVIVLVITTFVSGATDEVIHVFPPIVAPLPITVCPPKIVAFA